MTCEELREQYELYALGLLDEPELSELQEHLAREGDACIVGVRRARELMASLAGSVPLAEPPAHLREKVLAQFGAPPRRAWSWTPVWIAVSAALAVAIVWVDLDRRQQTRAIATVQVEVQRKNAELARLNEALALMNDPAVKEVTFGAGAPAPPKGRVFVHPKQGVLLLAYNLPPAPAGKIYEMWVIPKGGSPVRRRIVPIGSRRHGVVYAARGGGCGNHGRGRGDAGSCGGRDGTDNHAHHRRGALTRLL